MSDTPAFVPPDIAAPIVAKPLLVMMLVDVTGSMASRAAETVSGINAMVDTLAKELPDNLANFSEICLAEFDWFPPEPMFRVRRPWTSLKSWIPFTAAEYKPRGYTPLYDAMANAILTLDSHPNAKKRKRVAVVTTDGCENASKEWTREKLRKLIAEHTASPDFQINMLGASLASIENDAMDIGVSKDAAAYVAQGNYAATARMTASTMAGYSIGARADTQFSARDKASFANVSGHAPPLGGIGDKLNALKREAEALKSGALDSLAGVHDKASEAKDATFNALKAGWAAFKDHKSP